MHVIKADHKGHCRQQRDRSEYAADDGELFVRAVFDDTEYRQSERDGAEGYLEQQTEYPEHPRTDRGKTCRVQLRSLSGRDRFHRSQRVVPVLERNAYHEKQGGDRRDSQSAASQYQADQRHLLTFRALRTQRLRTKRLSRGLSV